MASRKPLTSDRVTDQTVAEALLEQEERRIRQGMRLHQEVWRKEHGPKRTVQPTRGAILLASGIFRLGELQILGSMIYNAADFSSSNARINGSSVSG